MLEADFHEKGTPYVFVNTITSYFNNELFKRPKKMAFSRDVVKRALDSLGVDYQVDYVYRIKSYARCYLLYNIQRLVMNNRSRLLDALVMKQNDDNKPTVVQKPSSSTPASQPRKAGTYNFEKPDVIPGEDMDTVSKELLRDQEVFY